MIEQGIVERVNSNSAVAALLGSPGGSLAQVPKGAALPTWTYQTVSNISLSRNLTGVAGLRMWRVQVDCYGYAAADAVNLSKAIAVALNGFKGTLADPDSTIVDSAFLSDIHDPAYDEASRTWRRIIEFEVNYVSQF